MTAKEGDMMGTEYGGKLVGSAYVKINANKKGSANQSITLQSTSNIDYVIFRQLARSDNTGSTGNYNTIICNSILLYKGGSVCVPASQLGNTGKIVAAIAKFNTNGSIVFSAYDDIYGTQAELLNIEMYSFT